MDPLAYFFCFTQNLKECVMIWLCWILDYCRIIIPNKKLFEIFLLLIIYVACKLQLLVNNRFLKKLICYRFKGFLLWEN